jgi:hypothetical protein
MQARDGRTIATGLTGIVLLSALACTGPNPAFWPLGVDAGGPPMRDGAAEAKPNDPVDAVDVGAPVDMAAPRDVAEVTPPAPDVANDLGVVELPPDLSADRPAGRRVVLSGSNPLIQQGGSSNGSLHTDACPEDEVIIGYRGTTGSTGVNNGRFVFSLEAACGVLSLPQPYGVLTVTPSGRLPKWGGTGDMPFEAICLPNQVVVGITGRAGSSLDSVEIVCGLLATSSTSSPVVVTSRTPIGRVGGTTGTAYDGPCPGDQVARGQRINDGSWIDAFGLICGEVQLSP